VASLLGCSFVHVWRLSNAGRIPYVKPGKRWRRYRLSDVIALQQQRQHERRAKLLAKSKSLSVSQLEEMLALAQELEAADEIVEQDSLRDPQG
jgi:hypothetical protein